MRVILFGLLLGFTAGFLYAPVSGRRARAALKNKLASLGSESREFVRDKKARLKEAIEMTGTHQPRFREELDEQMEAVAGR